MSATLRQRMVLAVVVGAALLAALLLSGCGGPKVPDVVGMRQDEAVRALQDAGYLLGDVSAVATNSVGVGLIAAQDPAAGERLKEGKPVALAVNFSDGVDTVVPTVTGLQEVTAVNVAKTSNLVPLVTNQYSDDTAVGMVAAQSPSPQSQVKAGDTLVIVVSKGKAPATAEVPNVKGKSQSDAESAIEKAGFTFTTTKVYYDSVAKGKVITQEPAGGSSATKGTKVQIVVSLGKGTGAATVPSVKGKSESSAKTAITDAGFKAKVIKQYNDSVAKGNVIDQFPAGGSKAAAGSEVLIAVSNGKQPAGTVAVPDVMGMTEIEAVSAIEAAGLVAAVEQLASADVAAGNVGYQFPAAGTQVTPGSEVLVAVSSGPAPE